MRRQKIFDEATENSEQVSESRKLLSTKLSVFADSWCVDCKVCKKVADAAIEKFPDALPKMFEKAEEIVKSRLAEKLKISKTETIVRTINLLETHKPKNILLRHQ